MTDASHDRERFTLLDGMRGVAALVVITDHVPSDALMALLPGRYLAVDFFFALSGFVLMHVYGARLASGALSLREFMRVRLIRFYPLYFIALAAGVVLIALSYWKGWVEASRGDIVASALIGAAFLPTPPPLAVFWSDPFPFNGPSWSLFFELVVNVVFAALILKLNMRVLAAILVVSGAALIATAFAFGRLDVGFLWQNFVGGLPRVTYAFFAGVLIFKLRDVWRAPAMPPWLAMIALVAIFMVPATGVLRPVWDLTAALLLFPALIMFCANSQVRGITAAACAFMGMVSYGVYVLQVPVRNWTDIILGALAPEGFQLPGLVHVLLIASLTVAAAAMLHMVYDVPARRFLARHFLARKRAAAIAASSGPTQF